MKCPNDGAVLTMSERSGVEIDYCPECRGVWLDRGELDKILDRAAAETPPLRRRHRSPGRTTAARPDTGLRRSSAATTRATGEPKRKEHWLSELFD